MEWEEPSIDDRFVFVLLYLFTITLKFSVFIFKCISVFFCELVCFHKNLHVVSMSYGFNQPIPVAFCLRQNSAYNQDYSLTLTYCVCACKVIRFPLGCARVGLRHQHLADTCTSAPLIRSDSGVDGTTCIHASNIQRLIWRSEVAHTHVPFGSLFSMSLCSSVGAYHTRTHSLFGLYSHVACT